MISNLNGAKDGLVPATFHDLDDGSGFFSQHGIMTYKDFDDSEWFYSAPAGRASRLATISFKS